MYVCIYNRHMHTHTRFASDRSSPGSGADSKSALAKKYVTLQDIHHSATCRASRLIQLKAARRPTVASRHSTSERRV